MTTRTASPSRTSRSRRGAHPRTGKQAYTALSKRYKRAEAKLKQTQKALTAAQRKLKAGRSKGARVMIAGSDGLGGQVVAALRRTHSPLSIEGARKISSADLRAKSGEVLQKVLQEGTVVVTHHGRDHVVVLSVDSYTNLVRRTPPPDLTELEAGFDRLVRAMQTPEAKKGIRSLSELKPGDFRRAAHAAATGRGRN